MPPKRTETAGGAAAAPAAKAARAKNPSTHPPFLAMILEAILTLKERNGCSRQSLKKFILANNRVNDDNVFTAALNRALRTGVEKGHLVQPKGKTGSYKIAKKQPEPKKAAPKKAKEGGAADKPKEKKKAAPKPKKATAKADKPKTEKKATAKKPAAPKKTTTTKEKKPVAPKAEKGAGGLKKTKEGRVAKPKAIKKTTASGDKKKSPSKKAHASPMKATADKKSSV